MGDIKEWAWNGREIKNKFRTIKADVVLLSMVRTRQVGFR